MMDALIVTFVERLKQKAATDTDGMQLKILNIQINTTFKLIYRASCSTSNPCEERDSTTIVLEQQIESIDSGNFWRWWYISVIKL